MASGVCHLAPCWWDAWVLFHMTQQETSLGSSHHGLRMPGPQSGQPQCRVLLTPLLVSLLLKSIGRSQSRGQVQIPAMKT